MYACESGNADCVKVLLENGASLNNSQYSQNNYCSVSIVLILSISCILCTPRYSLKIFVMSYSCTCLILGIMNEVVNYCFLQFSDFSVILVHYIVCLGTAFLSQALALNQILL